MDVTLKPWSADDLAVLQRVNSPEMTRFLGGPETEQEVLARHRRYLRLNESGDAQMFRIDLDGHPVGGIGFWKVEHRGMPAFETGWSVELPYQGRGIAREALNQIVEKVAALDDRDLLVAYPGVENTVSNALCEGAGFELRGTRTELWRGSTLTFHEWVLDLTRVRSAAEAH